MVRPVNDSEPTVEKHITFHNRGGIPLPLSRKVECVDEILAAGKGRIASPIGNGQVTSANAIVCDPQLGTGVLCGEGFVGVEVEDPVDVGCDSVAE